LLLQPGKSEWGAVISRLIPQTDKGVVEGTIEINEMDEASDGF